MITCLFIVKEIKETKKEDKKSNQGKWIKIK